MSNHSFECPIAVIAIKYVQKSNINWRTSKCVEESASAVQYMLFSILEFVDFYRAFRFKKPYKRVTTHFAHYDYIIMYAEGVFVCGHSSWLT